MKRYGALGVVRCQTPTATILVDVVTPARTATPAGGGVAVVTVEGGACQDSNETFVATPSGPAGWTLSDPILKGFGVVTPDGTPDGTYAVSFAFKDASSLTDPHAYVEARATSGILLTTIGES